MEKLLIATMKNPTLENKRKLIAYEKNHPMGLVFLTREQVTILSQYRREVGQ